MVKLKWWATISLPLALGFALRPFIFGSSANFDWQAWQRLEKMEPQNQAFESGFEIYRARSKGLKFSDPRPCQENDWNLGNKKWRNQKKSKEIKHCNLGDMGNTFGCWLSRLQAPPELSVNRQDGCAGVHVVPCLRCLCIACVTFWTHNWKNHWNLKIKLFRVQRIWNVRTSKSERKSPVSIVPFASPEVTVTGAPLLGPSSPWANMPKRGTWELQFAGSQVQQLQTYCVKLSEFQNHRFCSCWSFQISYTYWYFLWGSPMQQIMSAQNTRLDLVLTSDAPRPQGSSKSVEGN